MAATPERWDVEDERFWQGDGKRIATRNLIVSIPNLLCGFAVWAYWGMIAKTIQRLHFANPELFNFTFLNDGKPYSVADYKGFAMYLLPAVAGLVGATLRIPNSFMVAICGGRNAKFMTTLLLILPALGAGIALQDPNTPFLWFIVLAGLSGIGGGAFASSMSNISFFFPKRMQGLSLGLNAGIGNLGVSVMQFLIPWAITFGMFGDLGGEGYAITEKGASVTVWVQNAGLVWVPVLAFLTVLACALMNNLPQHQPSAGPLPVAVAKYLWLMVLGFAAGGVGVFALVAPRLYGFDLGEVLWTFLVLVLVIPLTLGLMRYGTPKTTRESLHKQFVIFGNKHNWVMTWLYVMTFGSFIGYSFAFPKLIGDVFGWIAVDENGQALAQAIVNPNAPKADAFIFLGAGVGALIRPVGGWLSDKWGGAKVTQWDTWVMVAATIAAGYFVWQARLSPRPEEYFAPFLISFIVLFATTGIGNGSTFRMIPIIFSKDQAGPVLGWTSAVAAYGAYLIPKLVGTQIKAGTPEIALYGFAGYYASCLLVNWWYYARKNAEIKC